MVIQAYMRISTYICQLVWGLWTNPPCELCPQAVGLEMTEGCGVMWDATAQLGWEGLYTANKTLCETADLLL